MNMTVSGYSSITNGESALRSARIASEKNEFAALLREMKEQAAGGAVGRNVSSDDVSHDGRLNGDYTSGFSGAFSAAGDRNALPSGAAANQANPHVQPRTIDKTSKLYEKSLEMESYIVKMMLSSMRKTVMNTEGQGSCAKNMYEDMLYDEYATLMTKNAGFGLADQMYLQLAPASS